MVNKGEKLLHGLGEDGTPIKIPVQVAGVNRTLFSVRRMEEAGNVVIFGLTENLGIVDMNNGKLLCQGGGNMIMSRNTGKLTRIRDNGRDYLMDVYVKKPAFHRLP